MTVQDWIAVLTFALAIAGVVFALGKQAQSIATEADDLNNIDRKLESHIDRTDRRLDDLVKFTVRVDQRVANLERQVFGDDLNGILRSGVYKLNDDDTPV